MSQLDIIWEIKEYFKQYPEATLVNLGCGLDETGKAWYKINDVKDINKYGYKRCIWIFQYK